MLTHSVITVYLPKGETVAISDAVDEAEGVASQVSYFNYAVCTAMMHVLQHRVLVKQTYLE